MHLRQTTYRWIRQISNAGLEFIQQKPRRNSSDTTTLLVLQRQCLPKATCKMTGSQCCGQVRCCRHANHGSVAGKLLLFSTSLLRRCCVLTWWIGMLSAPPAAEVVCVNATTRLPIHGSGFVIASYLLTMLPGHVATKAFSRYSLALPIREQQPKVIAKQHQRKLTSRIAYRVHAYFAETHNVYSQSFAHQTAAEKPKAQGTKRQQTQRDNRQRQR
jgi:hypothetical protein